MNRNTDNNLQTEIDSLLQTITEYVINPPLLSPLAYQTARYCLMDAIGCALLALQYPACYKLLGPIVPNTLVPNGSRVIGTSFELDPILAAFNIGALIRWLDFNDTWLAAEWAHPSDNLGGILAVADFIHRNQKRVSIHDVLTAMIKAYEIQGILALENSFNRMGLDHVILVKVATAAVVTHLLGGSRKEIIAVLSHAFIDGHPLRTYRHAPNTGSRKSWAAGDATSRAVQLAWWVMRGEMGYMSPLTAKKWGFNDVLFDGQALKLARPLQSYVMENILFKIAFPAEFHAQTAIECAIALHPTIKNHLQDIQEIIMTTQEPAIRIISKVGPLHNPADRDHCLQYMVAAALLFGDLKAEYYEEDIAKDPRIDLLREKMVIIENKTFSQDYLNPEKRSISNAIQIIFKSGKTTETIQIEYPLGHKKRREEGIPLLFKKFSHNLSAIFPEQRIEEYILLFKNEKKLDEMSVSDFITLFLI